MVKTPAFANIIKATGVFLGSVYLLYGRDSVDSTAARGYGGRAAGVSRSPEGGLIRRDKEAWETQEEYRKGGYADELAREDKYGGPKYQKVIGGKEGLSLSRGRSVSYSTGHFPLGSLDRQSPSVGQGGGTK